MYFICLRFRFFYLNAGNGLDTTEDACQGDSGGPLVGHFHNQIKPLELFPKESDDATKVDPANNNTYPIKDSPLNSTNPIDKDFDIENNQLADFDPNSMRLENFIKLDLTSKRKIQDMFLAKRGFIGDENSIYDVIQNTNSRKGKEMKDRINRDVSSLPREKKTRNRNLIWLNSEPQLKNYLKSSAITKRSLRNVDSKEESEKRLKYINSAGSQNKNTPNDEYIFRRFNFHQPAEGELSESSNEYDNKYRVSDSKMNAFLDKVHQTLKSKKADFNHLVPKRTLSQRQNSRHMDLRNSAGNRHFDESETNNKDDKKIKSLGRFLWSVPNNDTKIAIESMINAGIQASILSALEHFKELQEQQNKFFQQQQVRFHI